MIAMLGIISSVNLRFFLLLFESLNLLFNIGMRQYCASDYNIPSSQPDPRLRTVKQFFYPKNRVRTTFIEIKPRSNGVIQICSNHVLRCGTLVLRLQSGFGWSSTIIPTLKTSPNMSLFIAINFDHKYLRKYADVS